MTAGRPLPDPPSARQRWLVLVGLMVVVSLYVAPLHSPNNFIFRDASFYATYTRGLVDHGSFDQAHVQPATWYSGTLPNYRNLSMYWSNVSVGQDGTWLPKHPYVMSVVAVPFYAAMGPFGLLIFNMLCVALMLWCAFLIARHFVPTAPALLAVLSCFFTAALLGQTYSFSLDVFSAFLAVAALAAMLKPRALLAGALAGLAIWCRPVLGAVVVPIGLALLWGRLDRRGWLRLCVAGGIPLGVAALVNTLWFGAPWVTSYDRILTVVNTEQSIESVRTLFDQPWKTALERLITADEHGLLHRATPALVALAGLVPLFFRARGLTVAIVIALAGFVGVYGSYQYFEPRFFIAWLMVMSLPLALLIAWVPALGGRGWQALKAGWTHLTPVLPDAKRQALAGAVLLGGFVVAGVAVGAGERWALSDHILDAHVDRNGVHCDYFNMREWRWECSGMDRQPWERTGLELTPGGCEFNGHAPVTMVWLHPPPPPAVKRIRVPTGASAPVEVSWGLAKTSGGGKACFEIGWDGAPLQTLCATAPGELLTQRLPAPADGAPGVLNVTVKGTRGKLHMCMDARLVAPTSPQPRDDP